MTRPLALALLASTALVSSALVSSAVVAQELPSGGSVVAGSAAIGTPHGGTIAIDQTSARAVIDWRSFSVGEGGSVVINQPNAAAALLNRVTGTATSTIAGQITANGQVFLVNPNGILITKTGSVNASGFVASTLGIANDDFMAGRLNFGGAGGRVANAGSIAVVRGGYAGLLGGDVDNSGYIAAPLGRIGIGAAQRATLDLAGDAFLQIALPTTAAGGIAMAGRLSADGGMVVLATADAREAARHTVNLSGVIEARGLESHAGSVTLTGGEVALVGATIDVSGAAGGGGVRIGGDRQGGGTLAHATTVDIDAGSTIKADATVAGRGGDVTVWSDDSTHFAGAISAVGAGGGAGGEAEVSSKGLLAYTGSADLRGGRFGTLLLDPYNVTISNGADANHDAGLTATGNDSVVNATTLTAALGMANVTVSTGTGGAQAGNITVAAPLAWTTNATLTLAAAGNIALNSSIGAAAGGLVLQSGGAISAPGTVAIANFTLQSGAWSQVGALPAFAAGDFRIIGGSFVRATGGAGTGASPYILTDIFGLQGVGSLLTASYTLANDIDASGTARWNGGLGFAAIGSASGGYTGTFNGDGHVISRLTIARPGAFLTGLFGLNDGTIRAVGLSGGSITGGTETAGLIGRNRATATQLFSDASISGGGSTGGIVGRNEGSLTDSYTTGAVTGTSSAGGLVGINTGTIATSWSSGAVTGGGGLVGTNTGTVTNAYWDTATSGQATSAGGTGLTTAQARTAASYAGFDFTTIWYQAADLRPILRSQAGTAVGGSRTVNTLAQLQLVAANPGGTFVQGQDIDASPTLGTNAAGIWSTAGFVPIGTSGTFTGSYDGQDHRIASLVVNRPATDAVGLFGGGSGTVAGVALRNVSISGNNNVGALAGNSSLTVSNSSSTGTVTGANQVGGLVGNSSGPVSASQSGAIVIGSGTAVGGLIGLAGGVVATSSSTGSARGAGFVGGLIGRSSGTMVLTNSYSTASVFATSVDPVGGLVGYNAGTIATSYASGPVTGTFAGGLVGQNPGIVNTSYWDSQTTGQGAGAGQNLGTFNANGLTTANARTQGVYAGFDFVNTWYQTGDTRPFLRNEARAAVNGVVPVSSLAGLQLMALNLAATYRLTENIDASASAGSASQAGVFATTGIIPIGISAGNPFTGIFDGAGYTITGLTVNRPTRLGDGLFGYANGATLTNVAFVGGSVTGLNLVGGLVGNATNTQVSFVTNAGTVRGTDNIGGLVGQLNGGGINDSSTTGAVSGRNQIGGLVGDNEGGTLAWTFATGAIGGTDYLGGLVGYDVNGTIQTSYALGAVTGTGIYAGGLVGSNVTNSTIFQAYAQGNVTGLDFVGGLIGNTDGGGTIGQTYATGILQAGNGSTHVGALLGANGLQGLITTVNVSYFDSTRSGSVAVGTGSAAGITGFPTPVAQDLSTYQTNYVGFDFANVWIPPNQAGQGGIAAAHYPEFGRLSKAVVVRPVSATRVYGNLNPTMIAVYSYVRPGDFVTSPGTVNSTTTVTTPIGSYPITVTGVSVPTATQPPYRIVALPGTLTVTVRPVLVTGGLISVAYGGTPPVTTSSLVVPVGTPTSGTGLVNGDAIGSAAVLNPTASNTSPVGLYAYTPGNAVFTAGAASNYAVSYANGPLQVVARAIIVTADGQTRIYGNANPANGTATTTGLVNGDMISGVALASPATVTSPIGGYALTGSNAVFSAGSANNYAISYATVASGLTVTPRPITIAADAQSRIYGSANPALTYQVGGNGLVNGDTLTGAQATPATTASPVGPYAITQGTLAASANYAVSYTGNTLTVTPRPLTVTPVATGRVYGDANPASGAATAGNLVNGDTVASVTLTTPATVASNVGSYDLTGSNALGTGLSNYAITYATLAGGLSVTPRPLTISADPKTRVYGDANPALTYQIGGRGLVNGDMLTGGLTTPATPQSNVGAYSIQQGSLAATANYAVTYNPATLTVIPRGLSIAPTPVTRTYGDPNPTSGPGVPTGLVNNDTVTTVTLTTPATPQTGVGTVPLTPGNAQGTGLTNYTITCVTLPTALTIAPRSITIAANPSTRVYGDANVLTYTVGGNGLVNGDTLGGALASPATIASGIGSYVITLGTLANANYAIGGFAGDVLTIAPRPLVVTADGQARFVGQPNPALTYQIGGRGLVNGDVLSGVLTTAADANSAAGDYAITRGTLAASANYQLRYVPGTLTVRVVSGSTLISLLAGTQARDTLPRIVTGPGLAQLYDGASTVPGTVMLMSVEPTLAQTCPRNTPCPDDVKTSGTGTHPYFLLETKASEASKDHQ